MVDHILRVKKLTLLAGDIIVFYIAVMISLYLRYNHYFGDLMLKDYLFYFTFILPTAILIFYINDLYNFEKTKNNLALLLSIIKSAIFIFLAISVYFYFISTHVNPKTILLIFILALIGFLTLWRYSINSLLGLYKIKKNAIIISSNIKDRSLIKDINNHPEYNYYIKYFLDPNNYEKIKKILKNEQVDSIILGTDVYASNSQMKILNESRSPKQEIISTKEFCENVLQKIPLFAYEEVYLLENTENGKFLYEAIKRISDLTFSIIAGIFLLILFVPLATAIKLDSPGPIFFRQKRAGKNGKEFIIIKFRSMIKNAEANGTPWTKEKDSRITRVGNFIRRTRLDELPQIINIFKGEMSFIGPRPEQPELQNYLIEKIPLYKERNLVKPGLTGWAQIKQHDFSIDDRMERLQYDLYYIKNRSFALDLLIIIKTINIVLEGRGK